VNDIDRAAQEAADKLERVAGDAATEAAEKLERSAEEAADALEKLATEAETTRVASEAKRQTQEKDRRIAEGGPQAPGDDETGRVEAETGRQEAETRRVLRDQRLLPRISLLVALPFALVAVVPVVVGLVLIQREAANRTEALKAQSLANCRAIESIKTEGRIEAKADFDRLPDTFRALGLEYTAAYQKITQAALRRKLVRFAADTCPQKPIPTKETP